MHFKLLPALLAVISLATPAMAHHPGENLDEVMGDREQFFQKIDEPAPPFELADADGNTVRLSDFVDKIVVLNFVFASCTNVCLLHSELIADVQSKINITPMKDMVQFITVTTNPGTDTSDVPRGYGEGHGLDPTNGTFLTARTGDPEATTRELSEAYNVRFGLFNNGQETHGVVTNVIDRNGRLAAKFHGLRFDPVNLVLYINGLTNAPARSETLEDTGWWSGIRGLFP